MILLQDVFVHFLLDNLHLFIWLWLCYLFPTFFGALARKILLHLLFCYHSFVQGSCVRYDAACNMIIWMPHTPLFFHHVIYAGVLQVMCRLLKYCCVSVWGTVAGQGTHSSHSDGTGNIEARSLFLLHHGWKTSEYLFNYTRLMMMFSMRPVLEDCFQDLSITIYNRNICFTQYHIF